MPEIGEHDAPSDEMPQVMGEVIRWEPDAPSNEIQKELKFSLMM